MAKTILKKTESKVAVKLYGADLNETITLATDCLAATEALTVGGTPAVNILSMHWTGAADAEATITRGGVIVATLRAEAANALMFIDSDFTDTIGNTSNIVVTSTGLMQIWLLLRKAGGYSSKIETAQFSVYDDITKVGE
jgi:hypothetical protein